jgi:hypothetical protein
VYRNYAEGDTVINLPTLFIFTIFTLPVLAQTAVTPEVEVKQVLGQIRTINTQWKASAYMQVAVIKPSPATLSPAVFKKLTALDATFTAEYVALQPAIVKARADAISQLKMTKPEAAQEAITFQRVNKLALTATKITTDPHVDTDQFRGIDLYLTRLSEIVKGQKR